MEARFDVWILRQLNWARAIDGVMFRREAWVVQSGVNTGTSCLRHHMAKETPARGETDLLANQSAMRWCPPVPPTLSRAIRARPAQGHIIHLETRSVSYLKSGGLSIYVKLCHRRRQLG